MSAFAENPNSPDPFGISAGFAATPPNPEPPDPENQDLAGRIKSMFLASYNARMTKTLTDNLYLAAIMGDAFLAVDRNTNQLYRILDSTQSQYASQNNQLITSYLALWGKLTAQQPDFQVQPGVSGGISDQYGARAAERFIGYFRTSRNTKTLIDQAKACAIWSSYGGLIEVLWDPQGGTDFSHCDSCGYSSEDTDLEGAPCPFCEQSQQIFAQAQEQYKIHAAEGMPAPQQPPPPGMMQCVNRGGPALRELDPRNAFFQPGVNKFENMQWYITREPVPVALARSWFPETGLSLNAESEVYPSHGAQWTLNADTDDFINEQLQDHLYLYRYVERASGLYPNGRVLAMANQRIIAERPGYFADFGRLPLFRFGWIPREGTPYFRPPTADAWHRQRELNRLETQKSEHTALLARTKVIIPYGSRIAADEVSAQSAQVLMPPAHMADAIKYLAPPQMGSDIYARSDQLVGDIRSMFAVTVQETAQQTDQSGRLAAFQESESQQTVGPILRAHANEEADMMRCLLILVQKYGDPDEKFMALGDDNQEIYSFQDLKFSMKGSNVGIVPSDGLSSNPALRRNDAANLLGQGFFGQPGMPDFKFGLYAKMAGVKVPGLVPDIGDAQVQAAVAATKQMEDGIQFQPQPWDDAEKFVKIFQDWLVVNGRYQQQKNPQAVQSISQAMQYYMQILFEAQAAAAQAAPGPDGQPAPNTGASPVGPGQSAPGGTPNNAGGDISQNANDAIKNADKQGESLARSGLAHE